MGPAFHVERSLEQRALGWGSARKPLRTRGTLLEDHDAAPSAPNRKAEFGQRARRPGTLVRRLARQQETADSEERRATLGGDGRWSEPSGDDGLVPPALCRRTSEHFGSLLGHPDPVSDTEALGSLAKEAGPAPVRLDKQPPRLGPGERHR